MGTGRRSREGKCWQGAPGVLLLVCAQVCVAATPPAVSTAPEIDWRTSPLDLDLRGSNGERFSFQCPPGKVASGTVLGTGLYTDGSSICAAAVHAGAIGLKGGLVTIEVRPGSAHYAGSLEHFVQSEGYEPFWSGSFLVVTAAQIRPPAPAGVEFSSWRGGRERVF